MDVFQKPQKDSCYEGYAAFNQDVALLEFGEIIVSKQFRDSEKVKIVSGGTSNHMEYVGEGMLTASIQGKFPNSPSPSLILQTLRELSINHTRGILVILSVNSTDLLNFGLAVERGNNDDLRLFLLDVCDDCRNNKYSKIEKRGLAGVVLINKIAGAMAAENIALSNIYNYCFKVTQNLASIGINIKQKLAVNKECAYCKKCATTESDEGRSFFESKCDVLENVVKNILAQLTENDPFVLTQGENIILFVNNIGGLNQNEQYDFVRHCLTFFSRLDVNIVKFYIGPYLYLNNDLDLTVTVLKVFDKSLLRYLDAECKATGWKPVFQSQEKLTMVKLVPSFLKRKCRLSAPIKGPKLRERAANIVQLCLQFACDALISCEKMLNKMDTESGDGDTGTHLRILAEVLNKRSCSNKLNITYPFTFFLSLSKLLENTIGSTMGCMYSIMFEAAAKTFGEYPEDQEVCSEMWFQALTNACTTLKKFGNVDIGDKTMYNPLEACVTYLADNLKAKGSNLYVFGSAVSRAEETAHATRHPGCKYPDPGAHAVGIWMRAVFEGAKLKCL